MPLPQEDRYTLADALSWDEQERIELIYGYPTMIAPAPARNHQEVRGELFGQLRDYLKGKNYEVYHAPFAVRPFERDGDDPKDVDTLVEPDITVVCDPSKLDDIGCKGAPDLVMEILSPHPPSGMTSSRNSISISGPGYGNTGSWTRPADPYRSSSWKMAAMRQRTLAQLGNI